MKFRALHRMLALLVAGLLTFSSIVLAGDAETKSAIDEAINNHYLMMELDKAEQMLISAADCADCSNEVKARAWMYVGIVRGSGKSDQAGAGEAFATAKGLDPNVQLDSDLSSEETKATFASAVGAAAPAEPSPTETFEEPPPPPTTAVAPGALPPPAGVPGEMICSPQGAPIGVNMPIPVSCSSDATIAEGFVKFKEPGSSDWKKIALQDMNGLWQAEIPCKFNATAGTLYFYVGVKDSSGEYVDQFGSKKDPASIEVTPSGAAPAFPGEQPVEACAAGGAGVSVSDCPPDFPGCGAEEAVCGDLDWGASCKNSSECKCGLLCEDGACATAPTCSTDDECSTGACVDGYCSALRESGGGSKDFKRFWLGLSVGMDFMPYGGENLCDGNEGYQDSYGIQCYNKDGSANDEITGVDISSGLAPGQLRIKLGFDYALTDHILLGVRLGIGVLNSHPRAEQNGQMQTPFLPLHAAARFSYSFTSLSKAGLRPLLYLGAGLVEVNAKVSSEDVDVYKLAGRTMVAAGGRLGYMFTPQMGLNLDVQGMFLFGNPFAVALHPALNFTYGF